MAFVSTFGSVLCPNKSIPVFSFVGQYDFSQLWCFINIRFIFNLAKHVYNMFKSQCMFSFLDIKHIEILQSKEKVSLCGYNRLQNILKYISVDGDLKQTVMYICVFLHQY